MITGEGRRGQPPARTHPCLTAAGARATRLETNRTLTEAISLYRASGYREVAAFNDEPYAHHWFEKTLDPPPGGTGASGPEADPASPHR